MLSYECFYFECFKTIYSQVFDTIKAHFSIANMTDCKKQLNNPVVTYISVCTDLCEISSLLQDITWTDQTGETSKNTFIHP